MMETNALVLKKCSGLILAPAAHAGPRDDYNYIQELYAFGISRQTLGLSPGAFLDVGNTICTGLGRGATPTFGSSPTSGATMIIRRPPSRPRHVYAAPRHG
jgi:hypothetical protein